MDQEVLKGTVSFIHHNKGYGTIDYELKGKSKSITFILKAEKAVNPKTAKDHRFRIGDVINFQVKRSEKGDKMIAFDIRFLYNTELEKLINRANIENRFSGYLKFVDDQYFIKEWDSYIFFPLRLSKWEKAPPEPAFQTAISFKLIQLDKPHSIAAELFSHDFSPAYRKAREYFDKKKEIEATVVKISPYAIYLDLLEGGIQAKLELPLEGGSNAAVGDKIIVRILHLTESKIVVKPV